MSPDTSASFPVLKTKRLTLRQLSLTDDKEIFALRSDKQVNKYLDRQPSSSIEDARDFINKIIKHTRQNEFYWAIALNSNDHLAGTICMFDFSGEHMKAEIGYELLPAYQGQGIMQEALTKVIAFALDDLGLKTIEAYTHLENKSSSTLLEKHNFKKQANTDTDADNMIATFKLSPT